VADRKYDFATKQFNPGSETDGKVLLKRGVNNSLDLEPTVATLFPNPQTTDWQTDPITMPNPATAKAIGGYWHYVEPFVLDPRQLYLPPPPPNSAPNFKLSMMMYAWLAEIPPRFRFPGRVAAISPQNWH
jgi:hypothetical protein